MRLNYLKLAIGLILLCSCKKECPDPQTEVSKTPEELLVAKVWKLDEMRITRSNGTTDYYKRGGASNSFNGNSDSLKFNINNTGVFYDFLGATYTTTWNFTDAAKSKMTLIINSPTPILLYLENIQITKDMFKYVQYITGSGVTYMASVTRVPN
jgi:hypothetical protein